MVCKRRGQTRKVICLIAIQIAVTVLSLSLSHHLPIDWLIKTPTFLAIGGIWFYSFTPFKDENEDGESCATCDDEGFTRFIYSEEAFVLFLLLLANCFF